MSPGEVSCVYHGQRFDRKKRKRGFYLLAVDKTVIEGKTPAMYANHSCEPNCDMVPWHYRHEPVGVLRTNRDVDEGKELTFNYRATGVTLEQLFECNCGSETCQQIIRPGYPLQNSTYLTVRDDCP